MVPTFTSPFIAHEYLVQAAGSQAFRRYKCMSLTHYLENKDRPWPAPHATGFVWITKGCWFLFKGIPKGPWLVLQIIEWEYFELAESLRIAFLSSLISWSHLIPLSTGCVFEHRPRIILNSSSYWVNLPYIIINNNKSQFRPRYLHSGLHCPLEFFIFLLLLIRGGKWYPFLWKTMLQCVVNRAIFKYEWIIWCFKTSGEHTTCESWSLLFSLHILWIKTGLVAVVAAGKDPSACRFRWGKCWSWLTMCALT